MARVLHIEDDEHTRRLVSTLLQRAGHEVHETDSGLEGIRLARALVPDLVLIDINLPQLDGYEVTLRLRSIRDLDNVTIVTLSAEGDRETSLAVGADGFIAKPINASNFVDVVRGFLEGHRESCDTGELKLREASHRIVERLEKKLVELSEANYRLQELARLRREFLQNLSHEFATPMTPVVGYLKLLLDEELGPLSDLQRKVLRSIEKSTRRLRGVTDTLLDVSALETGRMHYYERPYEFVEVATRALEFVRDSFDPGHVHFTFSRGDEEPLPGKGDPDKLRRAMVHVLDNAAKFTPPGGEVAVEVRHSKGKYELLVLDSGPGVATDELERIFEPFYQVDGSVTRKHGGVGLGLAFARKVTFAMGGGVDVESPPTQSVAGLRLGGTLVRLAVDPIMPPRPARPGFV